MNRYIKYVKRKYANLSMTKERTVQFSEALISFTFDDAPGSAFTNGSNILNKLGFLGTYYIALSFLDSDDPSYRFSALQLQRAIQEKHEIGCHTFSHLDVSQTNFTKSVKDIQINQQRFRELFPNQRFENFSYPFGAQTKAIKAFVGEQFKSARGIEDGLNCGRVDLLNLKACKLYENSISLQRIYQKIEEAIQQKAWLIFYTHDVKVNPSQYGCSPDYLNAVAQVCADLQLRVLPVREVLQLIEKTNNIPIYHA